VISWFQAFAFKCNLYRYSAALVAMVGAHHDAFVQRWGLYKLFPVPVDP
jgi:hypothetical protein